MPSTRLCRIYTPWDQLKQRVKILEDELDAQRGQIVEGRCYECSRTLDGWFDEHVGEFYCRECWARYDNGDDDGASCGGGTADGEAGERAVCIDPHSGALCTVRIVPKRTIHTSALDGLDGPQATATSPCGTLTATSPCGTLVAQLDVSDGSLKFVEESSDTYV